MTLKQMCFLKRKRGLIKKSIELSKLTGAKVFLTIITEDEQTATCYKSSNHDLIKTKLKIKTLESFGPDLDFSILKKCTNS